MYLDCVGNSVFHSVFRNSLTLLFVGGEHWYGAKNLEEKIKVDEFLDFWQSTLNPVALKLVQNKLMWKVRIFLDIYLLD